MKGKEEKGGGGERESRIIEVDNIVVCAVQDTKNDMEITVRGGRMDQKGGGDGLSTVGEGEEGLGVVQDDHHPLANRIFTVGGAYKALELNAKRTIDMGTRIPLKINKRGR